MVLLLFVALWFPHCFLFVVYFFYMCCDASIVLIVFNSCPLCFLLTNCVVMLAFWSPLKAAHFAVLLVVIKSGIGTQGEVSRL